MEKTNSKKKFRKINKSTLIKIIFLLYILILCSMWAVNMKYNSVLGPPDERMKYDICKFIYNNGTLPHGGDEQIRDSIWGLSYGFTPILSYMFSTILMKIISAFTNNPDIIFISTRFISVFCMVGYAFMNILISKKLFKEKIYRGVFIVLVTLLPQMVFLGSYLNNDALALLSISVIVYSWLLGIEKDWNYKSCILIGIGIGVCALSYYNAYGYILFSAVIYLVSNIIKKIDIKSFFKKGLIIFAIAFLIAGWWFIRNYILYNGDFLGLNTSREYGEMYAQEAYKPSNRSTPLNTNTPLNVMLFDMKWTEITIDSFIGVFGHLNIRMAEPIYVGYKLIFIVAIVGLLTKFINSLINKIKYKKNEISNKKTMSVEQKEKKLFDIIMVMSIIVSILLSIYYSYCSDFQPQGRYIMPMIIPFIYFIVKGIEYTSNNLIKNNKIKNIILACFIVLWSVMPLLIFFKYII